MYHCSLSLLQQAIIGLVLGVLAGVWYTIQEMGWEQFRRRLDYLLFIDLPFWFWGRLGRCPSCYGKEDIAICGTGCTNPTCRRYDSCVDLELNG